MECTKGLHLHEVTQNGQGKFLTRTAFKANNILKESSESLPRVMVEGNGDLNSKRAELTFVICYLLCDLGELLTLSETQFLCYMQKTSTLQVLGGPSEVVYHAQAL